MRQRSFHEMIETMTHEVWQNMRRAVETGRWADGRPLTDEQRALSLQAVIAWEQRHQLPEDERTGYVTPAGCGDAQDNQQPINLRPAGDKRNA